MQERMKVIAESAFNHQGDFEELKRLALAAKNAGADFFTCQMMNVDAFCVSDYAKYELYKKTEFSKEQWFELFDYCKLIDLEIIPCILEEESFKWCNEYGFNLIKLHATDITNAPLLNTIAATPGIRVILETQCASTFEVEFALSTLGKGKIEALFSGYSNYPTEIEDFNLNVLDTFKTKYNLPVGFADHSLDTANIPLMLLAKGCKYIEKHITSTRNNRNFDYQVSLYPHEFATMVSTLKHYSLALGNGVKHPLKNEHPYRTIMYKKMIDGQATLKRADKGAYFIEHTIDRFDKHNVVVALIARLKSQRLKQKVLKPFCKNELIIDLYNRIATSDKYKTILATSDLVEDEPLYKLFVSKGLPAYQGDAISVIDRMLNLAYQEKASAIFRVTGDNPFTDPKIMEQMVELLNDNDLDYVKVNNVPFGVGAELFSTKYLWQLYLKLETTEFSEYLTWYVLQDEDVKMGAIDIESDSNKYLVNLSVDLQEDFDRCKTLLHKIGDKEFETISITDILSNLDGVETVDDTKEIKLPQGTSIKLKDYLKAFDEKSYVIRKKIRL